MDLVPLTPEVVVLKLFVTFGSYGSKPSGQSIAGVLSSFMFPAPEMSSLMVTASLVYTSVCEIDGVSVNLPTPPLNPAGLPLGSAATWIVTPGAVSIFVTLV